MPVPDIIIVDWGRPGKPMVIISDGTKLTLDPPDRLTNWHKACALYATYELPVSATLSCGPKSVRLGFYGYLRVCNSLCFAKAGVSIFDLSDVTWRDCYDDQLPPQDAVDEVLAENDFPSSEE